MLSLVGIDAHTKPDEHIVALQPYTRNYTTEFDEQQEALLP